MSTLVGRRRRSFACGLVVLCGVPFLLYMVWMWPRFYISCWDQGTFVSTPGTLVSLEPTSNFWIGSTRGGHRPAAKVQYEYQFQGEQFAGERAAVFPVSLRRVKTELGGDIEAGASIDIWVNPDEPNRSLLVKVGPFSEAGTKLLAVGFFLLLGWLVVGGIIVNKLR